jgi:hypothetical protein
MTTNPITAEERLARLGIHLPAANAASNAPPAMRDVEVGVTFVNPVTDDHVARNGRSATTLDVVRAEGPVDLVMRG